MIATINKPTVQFFELYRKKLNLTKKLLVLLKYFNIYTIKQIKK